jgi:hypothetical protein
MGSQAFVLHFPKWTYLTCVSRNVPLQARLNLAFKTLIQDPR